MPIGVDAGSFHVQPAKSAGFKKPKKQGMRLFKAAHTSEARVDGQWPLFHGLQSLNQVIAVVLEITSSVFDDGHEISVFIDENVITAGFEHEFAAA